MENVLLNSFQKLIQALSANEMLGDFDENEGRIDWFYGEFTGVIYWSKGDYLFTVTGELHETDNIQFHEPFDSNVSSFVDDTVKFMKNLKPEDYCFWYRYTHRGRSIGCQPKGFVAYDDDYGKFGKVGYAEPLQEKQLADYELKPIIVCPVCENEEIDSKDNFCCICGQKLKEKDTMKKGDIVVFATGDNKTLYKVITDEYEFLGRKVVDLEGYSGEVAVDYLKKLSHHATLD